MQQQHSVDGCHELWDNHAQLYARSMRMSDIFLNAVLPTAAAPEEPADSASLRTGPTQEYDPWAGQHVPSQGFSPHLAALDQSPDTTDLDFPAYPPQQFPAGAAMPASSADPAAASLFPMSLPSPFSQAGYPATSDLWNDSQDYSASSDPAIADPSFPTSSPQQDLWVPSAAYPAARVWDPATAAANPWDTYGGDETPAAVLGGDNGGLDSGYRSTDGRPAVALFVFGFAGKLYCWRPAVSPGALGLTLQSSFYSCFHR